MTDAELTYIQTSFEPLVTETMDNLYQKDYYVGSPPYIEKLIKKADDSYYDGNTSYIFDDTSLSEFEIREQIMATHEYKEIVEKAKNEYLNSGAMLEFVCKLDDVYYFEGIPIGGGSGDKYMYYQSAQFFSLSVNGEFFDYGIFAAHVKEYNGCFYFVELYQEENMTRGNGKIRRINLDGTEISTVINEIVYGSFSINDDKIYFVLSDKKTYSANLDGTDEMLLPATMHATVGGSLYFYGDIVLNYSFVSSGKPVVTDRYGNNLISIPEEMSNFHVIYYEEDWCVLRAVNSNSHNASYWVYRKG